MSWISSSRWPLARISAPGICPPPPTAWSPRRTWTWPRSPSGSSSSSPAMTSAPERPQLLLPRCCLPRTPHGSSRWGVRWPRGPRPGQRLLRRTDPAAAALRALAVAWRGQPELTRQIVEAEAAEAIRRRATSWPGCRGSCNGSVSRGMRQRPRRRKLSALSSGEPTGDWGEEAAFHSADHLATLPRDTRGCRIARRRDPRRDPRPRAPLNLILDCCSRARRARQRRSAGTRNGGSSRTPNGAHPPECLQRKARQGYRPLHRKSILRPCWPL